MKVTDYFAETMVQNAVEYSLNKLCYANVLIAGPICSGKEPIADGVKSWFNEVRHAKVTLMNQSSFYHPLDEIPQTDLGYKVDSIEAFYADVFTRKVRRLFDKGISSSPYYNFSNWTKGMPEIEKLCKNEEQRTDFRAKCDLFTFHSKEVINIFVGSHVISLLGEIVPNCVKVYLNTDFDVCMERRLGMERYRKVANYSSLIDKRIYTDFVRYQIQQEIEPQKEVADIVLKANG